jgi:hypothetical protein
MHSLLRHTVLCLSLAASTVVFAQSDAPTAPAAPQMATPAAPPAAPAPATATQQAAATQPSPATSTSTTTAAAGNSAIGAPPAGKGQIVFFRDKKFVGSMISYMVREGTTELGKISNGSYFVVAVDPGTHIYTVHSEAKDNLTLEVEAGETYYVSSGITMGFMAGHPNLAPSDEATFDPLQPKLKLNK